VQVLDTVHVPRTLSSSWNTSLLLAHSPFDVAMNVPLSAYSPNDASAVGHVVTATAAATASSTLCTAAILCDLPQSGIG